MIKIISIMLLIIILTPYLTINNSTASPGFVVTETLEPNKDLASTLHVSDSYSNVPTNQYWMVSGNPGASSTEYWETNDTFLYWGNASYKEDESADWGVGYAIFHMSDPFGVSSTGTWQLSVTTYSALPVYLSDWINVGSVTTIDAPAIYHGIRASIGYTNMNNGDDIVHLQTYSNSNEGYWPISGSSSTTSPPTSFNRPTTGTQYWDVGNNSLENRAWSTSELYRLIVKIELRLEKSVFDSALTKPGEGMMLALCGISVAIAPSPYILSEIYIQETYISHILYYLVALVGCVGISIASSLSLNTLRFNTNQFLVSMAICICLMVWIPIIPSYSIVFAIGILVLLLFKNMSFGGLDE